MSLVMLCNSYYYYFRVILLVFLGLKTVRSMTPYVPTSAMMIKKKRVHPLKCFVASCVIGLLKHNITHSCILLQNYTFLKNKKLMHP